MWIPIRRPALSSSGPPELPGLIAASVWIRFSITPPRSSSIERFSAEMMPLVHRDRDNPLELFQIWLNLPSSDKLVDPYFTMLWYEDIPTVTATDENGHTTVVTVIAGELNVSALSSNVVVQKLSYVGSRLRSEVESIKAFAGSLDSVLDRFTQRVKRSFRTVTELDQVKAERIDYAAKQSLTMRGENAIVTAEQLVKFDGEQIHMG